MGLKATLKADEEEKREEKMQEEGEGEGENRGGGGGDYKCEKEKKRDIYKEIEVKLRNTPWQELFLSDLKSFLAYGRRKRSELNTPTNLRCTYTSSTQEDVGRRCHDEDSERRRRGGGKTAAAPLSPSFSSTPLLLHSEGQSKETLRAIRNSSVEEGGDHRGKVLVSDMNYKEEREKEEKEKNKKNEKEEEEERKLRCMYSTQEEEVRLIGGGLPIPGQSLLYDHEDLRNLFFLRSHENQTFVSPRLSSSPLLSSSSSPLLLDFCHLRDVDHSSSSISRLRRSTNKDSPLSQSSSPLLSTSIPSSVSTSPPPSSSPPSSSSSSLSTSSPSSSSSSISPEPCKAVRLSSSTLSPSSSSSPRLSSSASPSAVSPFLQEEKDKKEEEEAKEETDEKEAKRDVNAFEVSPGVLFLPGYLSFQEHLLLARECFQVYSSHPHVCNFCASLDRKAKATAHPGDLHVSPKKKDRAFNRVGDRGEEEEEEREKGRRDDIEKEDKEVDRHPRNTLAAREKSDENISRNFFSFSPSFSSLSLGKEKGVCNSVARVNEKANRCRYFDGRKALLLLPLSSSSSSSFHFEFLRKELRWVTLGKHYNWTTRLYDTSSSSPPSSSSSSCSSSFLLSSSDSCSPCVPQTEEQARGPRFPKCMFKERIETAKGENFLGRKEEEEEKDLKRACKTSLKEKEEEEERCVMNSSPQEKEHTAEKKKKDVKGLSEAVLDRGEKRDEGTKESYVMREDTFSHFATCQPRDRERDRKNDKEKETSEEEEEEEKHDAVLAKSERKATFKGEKNRDGDKKREEEEEERDLIDRSSSSFPKALQDLCHEVLHLCADVYLSKHFSSSSLSLRDLHSLQGPPPKLNAGILNVYRRGDRLRGHKDDVERSHVPLVSISLGQPAIFLIGGHTREILPKALVLRSGDVLVLSGGARWAIHGVPKLLYYTPVPTPPCIRLSSGRKKKRSSVKHHPNSQKKNNLEIPLEMKEELCQLLPPDFPKEDCMSLPPTGRRSSRDRRGTEDKNNLEIFTTTPGQDTSLFLSFLREHHGLNFLGVINRERLRRRFSLPRWQQMLTCLGERSREREVEGRGDETQCGRFDKISGDQSNSKEVWNKGEKREEVTTNDQVQEAPCFSTKGNTNEVCLDLSGNSERSGLNSIGKEVDSFFHRVHALLKEVRLNLSCRRDG
ncbi:2og-fe oxygenase family protein [Cystoisospora suis]|uniref:2og-fe oxygenase family protein n=1 Tax=Cystoisospora suis TaxID=483139 RepID=A0A2C6L198_9APIC|nr:2og-fe oxygenase family protein [Cystoisospora suis]